MCFFSKIVWKIFGGLWKMLYFCPLERWQSGRLRRSWKPLSCEAPGVRIPPSPQDHEAKRYREIDTFCFYTLSQACLQAKVWKTKDGRLAAFCAVGLQGPLRRAEGKGVKRSDHRERSSQFSLSALNSLQGVDFQPCRLFLCQKNCTKMHRTHFYTLIRDHPKIPVGE